jgi:hypothetical protein
MADVESGRFPWLVWHHGDPGPPIWDIIAELEGEQQRAAARIAIDTQIAHLNVTIQGMTAVKELLGKTEAGR